MQRAIPPMQPGCGPTPPSRTWHAGPARARRLGAAGPGPLLACYLAALLLGGALLAPPAYWVGRTLVDAGWLPQLAKFGFGTYLRRSWLLCALALAPLLARRLPQEALAYRPGARDRGQAARQLGCGLALGAAGVGALLAALVHAGWFVWRQSTLGAWAVALVSAAASAVFVATVEELSFRGVLQRALARRLPFAAAATLQVLAFAAVHFVALSHPAPAASAVGWDAGLRALGAALAPLAQPAAQWPQAATLLAVGAALTLAAHRAGTLWPALGVHAAWTFGLRLAAQGCVRVRPADLWLDHELRAGLLPTALALGTLLALAALPRVLLTGHAERRT